MVNRSIRGVARRALLATTALVALPGVAAAQSTPTGMINEAQGGSPVSVINDPSIVIAQPGTPTTALDTSGSNGVNGIGQMVVDQGNGFVGLCTGTLINPRTVIFAAHCVNENPAGNGFQDPWGYGAKQGGIPISFGFAANNIPALRAWLFATINNIPLDKGGVVNPDYHKTATSNFLYNVNQVLYNPDSTKLGLGNNFLQADVALASLDTPAANVPTWAVLFSALPAPSTIDATTGTGYHVAEYGYGNNGVGNTGGVGGIDFRRRAAENYVGLLGSLDDVDLFLFGSPAGLPQNLYQLDFDDPRRGTAGASRYDFNVFKDKALPNEGITSEGDSGGPLVLDRAFAKQVIIGVLSGGSRYYNAQAGGSYGTSAFYQPLYLFWDYIAANNPYRYASAKAGDGKWSDPTHWLTTLDPAYNVIVGGQLVNGIPTAPGDGIKGTSGKFGQICFDQPGVSDCYDNATKVETVNGKPVDATVPVPADAAATAAENLRVAYNATVKIGAAGRADGLTSIHEAQDGGAAVSSIDGMFNEATAGTDIAAAGDVTTLALPGATLANGLPGATNFVPNNIDPIAATKTNARYYDITLDAAGTTTLDTAVTIDRFTISGAQAKLNVTTAGSLTSLIGVNQFDGIVQVDGMINTRGDYLLLSGGLTGSGRINTPFLTSVRGMIAPGTLGTIGTLTVGGNTILSTGSVLLVDVGPNGTSDLLAGVATTFNGTKPTDGMVNVGGRVGFAPVSGYTIRSGDIYTIVTAQGGVSGVFNPAMPLSAILTPQFTYSANAVQAQIVAGRYRDVVANTPVQNAYAGLLDQNRSNQNNLLALYGSLDLQNQGTIQATLESLAPRTETLKYAIGTVVTENAARFYRGHLAELDPTVPLSGTLTMIGKPQQFASLLATDLPGGAQTMSDASGSTVTDGVITEGANVYIGGGYINGDSASMRTAVPFGGRDDFDGYYAVAGVDAQLDDHSVIGLGLNYTRVDGTTGGVAQQARGQLFQGTLYAKADVAGFTLDSQASAGLYRAETRRNINFVGTPYALRSQDNAFTFSGEVGLGKVYDIGSIKVGPRVAFRANRIEFTPTVETGAPGGPALRYDRQNLDSKQARAGLALAGNGVIKPFASAYYVHDFANRPGVFGANFVGGIGPSATFALAGDDQNWGEAALGLSYNTGAVELSVSANTTFERKDIKNQAYGGSVKIHF